jgi:hypothetical protein
MTSSHQHRQDRENYDDFDEAILLERVAARAKITGPRVGDFCRLENGDLRRFTHHHGDRLQTTVAGESGSFYFQSNGLLDYSGSLAKAIPLGALTLEDGLLEGRVWWFSHNIRRAHNGVAALIPCRIYREGAR